MDIHPAVVHFPIALLFLYALIELVPVARILPSFEWENIRRFLLYVGTAGAAGAVATGMMAERFVGESARIEAHEEAALTLFAIFLILTGITLFWKEGGALRFWIQKTLAAAGFVMLFVVGALGANIVYGSSIDPIVSFVARLFGV